MCYAALVSADLRRLEREFVAQLNVREFDRVLRARVAQPTAYKLPVAVERAVLAEIKEPGSAIPAAVAEYRKERTALWEAEIFQQRRRHVDAQRKLATKVTKMAQKELQVSADKIEQRLKWLNDFRERALTDEDAVVYPMHYAPLIIRSEEGRVITPMRYHCRLPGHAPEIDRKLTGNYNARIDSLEQWWRPVFGRHHGILVLDGFRENVKAHDREHRELRPGEAERNLVLQFNPRDASVMRVTCVWSRWQRDGEVLRSMALITDEPPEEVAAAGHNRCPINLTAEAALAWLEPDGRSSSELFEILSQRQRPYYEHRIAEAA